VDLTTVGVWTFGLTLILAGAGLLWFSFGKRGDLLVNLNVMVRNWLKLLSQAPGDAEVVASHPLGYRVRVAHYPGHYWGPEGLEVGSAARVHVAPDFVARLNYPNFWQGRSRLLDASAFCLRVEGKGEEVEMLARGVRIELVFNDSSMRSRDEYEINCHLAVHVWNDLPLHEEERLNRLFDSLRSFNDALRSSINGALSNELRARTYREALYEVPDILKVLAKRWGTLPELARFRELVHVAFTALVLKPRLEAERLELQRLGAGLMKLEEKIARPGGRIKQELADWQLRWDDLHKKRREALARLKSGVGDTIKAAKEGLISTMGNMSHDDEVLKGASALFDGAQKQLSSSASDVKQAFNDLAGFIREITKVNKQLMSEIGQMSDAGNGHHAVPRATHGSAPLVVPRAPEGLDPAAQVDGARIASVMRAAPLAHSDERTPE
jgi:hypothetical protein